MAYYIVHLVTILTAEAIVLGFPLKVDSTVLDLVWSLHIVTITPEKG